MSALPTFPATLIVQPDRIPLALQEGRKHVAWRWKNDEKGLPTKPPVNPDTGYLASSTGPSTWGTFAEALDRMRRDNLPGIGRVLTPMDDIAGIDLDHCVDSETGEIAPWAQEILDAFMPTYAEFSPSGRGVRIFVRGRLDGTGCKAGDTEVYDTERYLTMTGHPIPGAVDIVAERQGTLTALYSRLRAERRIDVDSAPLEFATDRDAEGVAILHGIRPHEAGTPRRESLTQRAWDLAHGEDTILKPTKNGPVPYEGESERRYALVCALYDVGLNDDEVKAAFKATVRWQRCVEAHGEQDAERRLTTQDMPNAKGFIRQQREEDAKKDREPTLLRPNRVDPETGEVLDSDLPRIDAGNHDIPAVAAQAWPALCAVNEPPSLFRHAGGVSRREMEDGRVVMRPLTPDRLRHELGRVADWFKNTKNGVVPADVPLRVVQDMLAHPNPPLPVLERIVHAPFFAADGRLVVTAGYDAESRTFLLLEDGLIIPPVPDAPSAEDVQKARSLILDNLLGDFPFVAQADRANAVAAMLQLPARPMINGSTPNHLFEASSAGSGKGLLADCITRPFVGAHVGVIAGAREDDEWRKRISAKLREGAPVILCDNITTTIDSGSLASAITAAVWTDRVLGTNETMAVPVRCLWVMTANNPTMTTEIARRSIRTRLDAMVDRPWQRKGFRHPNLIEWVDQHRAELIHAALMLIQAWIAAGKPKGSVTLGSFERWASVMGGILDNAGIPGFLANLDEFYEAADLEGAIWRQFVNVWWDAFKDGEVGAKSLFDLTDSVEGFDLGKGSDKAQRTTFGKQLGKQRDRVIGEYRIVFARVTHRAKMWRLIPITIQPLVLPEPDADAGRTEEGCSPPVYPCNTEQNGNDGGHRGTFRPPLHKDENDTFFAQQGAETFPDVPHVPPMPMPRLEMEAWARDIASGWGTNPQDLARAKAAARTYLNLTIPDEAAMEMTATLIVAVLKGAR